MNSKPTEFCPVIAALTPRTVANTETFSGYADLRDVQQALFVVSIGDAANETITVKLYESTDAVGGSEQALKTPAALTASASANDHKHVVIGVDRRELSAGYTHVRVGVVTSAETGAPVSIVGVGICPVYGPGTGLNLASVVSRTE